MLNLARRIRWGGVLWCSSVVGWLQAAEPAPMAADGATPATRLSPAASVPFTRQTMPAPDGNAQPALPSRVPAASVPLSQLLPVPGQLTSQSSVAIPGWSSAAVAPLLPGGHLPTAPTVDCPEMSLANAAPTGCADGACVHESTGRFVRSRYAIDRLFDWLSYKPAPGAMPWLIPAPYTAPLRSYVPCAGSAAVGGPVSPACAGSSGVGAGLFSRLGSASAASCPPGGCQAPYWKGYGALARPSGACPTTGPLPVGCAPVAIPLPAACVGCGWMVPHQPAAVVAPRNALDRLVAFFSPGYYEPNLPAAPQERSCSVSGGRMGSGCTNPAPGGRLVQRTVGYSGPGMIPAEPPTATVPYIMGYTFPQMNGYRFAHPTTHPSLLSSAPQRPLSFMPQVMPQGEGMLPPPLPEVHGVPR